MQSLQDDGSSPFIRTKETAQAEDFRGSDTLAHLAHFDDVAPGGAQLEEVMKSNQVTIHTTGPRWYVSYYLTENGKRERKREYGYVNKEKDPEKRMDLLNELQVSICKKIIAGIPDQNTPKAILGRTNIYLETSKMIEDKEPGMKYNAIMALKKNLKPWKQYVLHANLERKQISDITKEDILGYRKWLQKKTRVVKERTVLLSNRTINNYIDELRGLFNYIIDNRTNILDRSPLKQLANLPSRSEVHVAYTTTEQEKIFSFLQDNNPDLLFYIKFVAYIFFRCEEAQSLQIKHLDLNGSRILQTADNNKTSTRKYKIIPKFMLQEFYDRGLDKLPKDWFIFSTKGLPGPKQVNKDYFTDVYRPLKTKFNLTTLHTIYGFRHTSVCQLIAAGIPWHKIMKLTGHKTMESFQKYAESILAVPAEDLSDGFAVKY